MLLQWNFTNAFVVLLLDDLVLSCHFDAGMTWWNVSCIQSGTLVEYFQTILPEPDRPHCSSATYASRAWKIGILKLFCRRMMIDLVLSWHCVIFHVYLHVLASKVTGGPQGEIWSDENMKVKATLLYTWELVLHLLKAVHCKSLIDAIFCFLCFIIL